MNTKLSNSLLVALTVAGLAACNSAPQAVENPLGLAPAPPPDFQYGPPLIPSTPESPGRVCLLGTTCLAMDPRPFELCLLTTKHCKDKAAEPMLVGPPVYVVPTP